MSNQFDVTSGYAEALARFRSGGRVRAFSAGSKPKPLHSKAVRAMREAGIDLSSQRSRHVSVFATDSFDCVITPCDRVREACPGDRTYPLFKQLAAELETRIGYLLAGLAARPAQEAR